MPKEKLVWEEIKEFPIMASKLIDKYPERFGGIKSEWLIAWGCVNKERPEGKSKPYEMSGQQEPESFTNSKKYFVKLYMNDWEGRDEASRLWLVFSALERIDKENTDSGKVLAFDYKDQGALVRTLGADWQDRGNLPNLLKGRVDIVESDQREGD